MAYAKTQPPAQLRTCRQRRVFDPSVMGEPLSSGGRGERRAAAALPRSFSPPVVEAASAATASRLSLQPRFRLGGLLDVYVFTAHGVAHRFRPFRIRLVHDHFFDHFRLLTHDGLFRSLRNLDRRL